MNTFVGERMGAVSNEVIRDFTDLVVGEVRRFTESQVNHIYELVQIGLGLSSEKRIDRLLEMIVSEARRFTNADGGTLYIMNDENRALDFAIVQNETLHVHMGGSGQQISWPPVALVERGGKENHSNVSAYCALSGKAVNIADVYEAEGFDFQGTKDFDASTGYRSKSMLLIPMRDHEDEVIGVLQLLNARDKETGGVLSFPADEVEMVTSLASEAAIALTNMRLVQGLEDLMQAFVQTIGDAIDEKSPYTAGHIHRVSELTEKIAMEAARTTSGPFAGVSYSPEELTEIRMAAWLHDVGKITTPEFLMDKSTKLEAVFDRIDLVQHRLEILRQSQDGNMQAASSSCSAFSDKWQEAKEFLARVNQGGESLADESLAQIKDLAKLTYPFDGKQVPLLNSEEVKNLSIQRGTLTQEEREVMNHHVVMTIRMLQRLPFPKKLRNVPAYAGMHHEKMNGSGYPLGLRGEEIPLPARMLALADIVEALTAPDRPYKRGKMLSETMAILEAMADHGEIDGDLCDLLVHSGLIARYADEIIPNKQVDGFEWRGVGYSVEGLLAASDFETK